MNRRCLLLLVVCSFVLPTSFSRADDWPNWRGPNYDGRSPETDFAKSWEGDLKTLWETEIGDGYSGITVANKRVYTCGTADGKQVLFCLKAKTGKVVWQEPLEKRYNNSFGNGPRSTPTVDGDRVYIIGARGGVSCHDAKSGSKLWSQQFNAIPKWGYSGSVLIQGDLAVITAGGDDGGMKALNKKTGEVVWSCGDDKKAGYSTPYPFEFEGTKYVCGFLGRSAVVAELETGKEVLNMKWKTDWDVNAATPIFHKGHLFLASGYKTGCALFKLSKNGKKLKADEVWRSKVLMSKFQTPVLYKGNLYAFDQKAFKCVKFMTGEQKWKKRGKHGTVIVADGHVIALTQEGMLRVGKATAKDFDATGESEILDDRCWTIPTLANGRLYARNLAGRLVCVNMKSQKVAQR